MNKFVIILLSLFVSFQLASCRTTKITKKQSYMTSLFQELKNNFPDANVLIKNDSIKLIFSSHILFETGSAEIKPDFKENLQLIYKTLIKYNKTNLLIIGHTDNVGELHFNESLSMSRALSTKAGLVSLHLDSVRIKTWGMADREPIETNKTEEGRAKNRRVEFVILYKEE
ncbi:MAG TPA: OmpA family protein [Chitinophagaceae bacterium]|nr:MAG: membrane protein [Bacteroidetes bacterium OLB11]HMN32733.1 OmpA family protein [Chitinophagaceae bacterium]